MANRHQQLTGQDRWQVSYADLLTLLLGFFIVMYSVASMEKNQKKRTLEALQNSFLSTPAKGDQVVSSAELFFADIDTSFFEPTTMQVDREGDWVYLDVASETLFASGSAILMPAAEIELKKMATWLATSQGAIEVEGHTDNIPIKTNTYPDNWSLSSDRSVAIVSYLTAQGIEGKRFKAIGFGEFSPIADNTTEEGRKLNRRVVIKVESPPVPVHAMPSVTTTSNPVDALSALVSAAKALTEPAKLVSDDKTPIVNANNGDTQTTQQPLDLQDTLDQKAVINRIAEKGLAPQRLPTGGLKFSRSPQ